MDRCAPWSNATASAMSRLWISSQGPTLAPSRLPISLLFICVLCFFITLLSRFSLLPCFFWWASLEYRNAKPIRFRSRADRATFHELIATTSTKRADTLPGSSNPVTEKNTFPAVLSIDYRKWSWRCIKAYDIILITQLHFLLTLPGSAWLDRCACLFSFYF